MDYTFKPRTESNPNLEKLLA